MTTISIKETTKNDFLDYTIKRISERDIFEKAKLDSYFSVNNASKLYEYYNRKTTKCDTKGRVYLNGEIVCCGTTRIFLDDGHSISNLDAIERYQQKEYEENPHLFIEENLFHMLWCEMERIFRTVYKGVADSKIVSLFEKYECELR